MATTPKISKQFRQMVIYPNVKGFTAWITVTDSHRHSWELKGIGNTPMEAAAVVWNIFQGNETEWEKFGRSI
jgi:hypothetical protein